MNSAPFTPGNSVALPVTTASDRVALPPSLLSNRTIMITEGLGLEIAYIAFGDSTITAVAPAGATPQNGYPILPGSKEAVTIGPGITHIAAITASGTANLFITTGSGI